MSKLLKSWESRTQELLQKKWGISEREVKRLSKDFSLLLCVLRKEILKYRKLAEEKDISISVMFNSVVICHKCCLSEEEGKPISTGVLLTDSEAVARTQVLADEIEIPLPKKLHIRNWRRIRKLCGYVDGETATFVVKKATGIVEGAKNLSSALIGNRDAYSDITNAIKDSVAFLVVRGRKCFRVYSDGTIAHQVILVRKYGEWVSRDCRYCLTKLNSMATSKAINVRWIRPIFNASLSVSEQGDGAQFLITNRKDIQAKIKKETRLRPPKKIFDMRHEQLIRNVTKDGAAIFSKSGKLESIEAKFLATGGRVASIVDITKSAPKAMAIVVSVDSVISIVESGKVIMEL